MQHDPEEAQLEKATRVYRAALRSPFYAEKLGHLPAPRTIADWRAVPPLTRAEIYARSFPRSRDMLTGPLEDAIIISTGGSSGIARYTVYTHAEWDAFVELQSQALALLGIAPRDRVANLFIAGHFWPSFLGLHDCLKKLGAVHLPISANIAPDEIVKLCLEFDVTVMISLPTLFVFLADLALKEGFRFPALRMINYAGEHLSTAAEQHVARALGVERIKAGAYTSSDAGIMGYQCDHTPPGVYHVPTAFQWLEIIDFERGRPAAPGERGDVVVTNLSRVSTPIIRYRVGDVATWLAEGCPCGDRNPLLKLGGRAGEDFKLGGGFISMDAFERCVAAHAGTLSLNFQLEIADVGGQFELTLRVERLRPLDPDTVAQLREELFAAVPELRISAEKHYLRELRIETLDLGQLPRSPITGKVVRLKDHRVS